MLDLFVCDYAFVQLMFLFCGFLVLEWSMSPHSIKRLNKTNSTIAHIELSTSINVQTRLEKSTTQLRTGN